MFKLNLSRIPFHIRMAEGIFKGEAIGIGDCLTPDCMFEIHLTNGEVFYLKGERDQDTAGFNWTARATEKLSRLFPVLGRLIERHYAKSLSQA